jgi:hypothetical protein
MGIYRRMKKMKIGEVGEMHGMGRHFLSFLLKYSPNAQNEIRRIRRKRAMKICS